MRERREERGEYILDKSVSSTGSVWERGWERSVETISVIAIILPGVAMLCVVCGSDVGAYIQSQKRIEGEEKGKGELKEDTVEGWGRREGSV